MPLHTRMVVFKKLNHPKVVFSLARVRQVCVRHARVGLAHGIHELAVSTLFAVGQVTARDASKVSSNTVSSTDV